MTKQKLLELIKKTFNLLHKPMAVGVYITIGLTLLSVRYYEDLMVYGDQLSGLTMYINDIDRKSVDYRLKFRGQKPPSDRVAILAVDDRSLEILGRWPWPRDRMGMIIDRALQFGANVISSDMVWSERTERPEVALAEKITQTIALNKSAQDFVGEQLKATDSDRIFGDYIDKNRGRFIIGNYYNLIATPQHGYPSVCHDLIIKQEPITKLVEKQALPLVIIDNQSTLMPEPMAELFSNQLDDIRNEYKNKNGNPTSGYEAHKQNKEILSEKIRYCGNAFLEPNKDPVAVAMNENWDAVKQQVPELSKFANYGEWADFFKKQYPLNLVAEAIDWTTTIPQLSSRGEHFGYFNAVLDKDGVIRKSQLIMRAGTNYIPSIALQAYLIGTDQQIEVTMDADGFGHKGIASMTVQNRDGEPQFKIPVTKDGRMVINYVGHGRTIPHISIADLLNDNDPLMEVVQYKSNSRGQWDEVQQRVNKKDFLKDKILVLGATAIGVYDLRVTPFDENFPGVETHANVIDNLLRKDFLSRHPAEGVYMPLIILATGLTISFALSFLSAITGLAFTAFLILLMGFIDKQYLFSQGHLVSIILPLFQVGFTYVFLTFYKYFTEERSKKELRATFSKYVSPAIVEEILQDPKNLELGGRKERVTVFFSDVRGFTTISEKLDPKALSDLLNSYLTPMTGLIFKNQGTLDKYMGDAIMAFFGAPVHYPEHAKMACRCALQSLEVLKQLQSTYEKKKLPMIDIGIGLNTGECSVGNMGSETVRSYTVMGDAVNLASRLEGINKTYGTHIIISEFTYNEVKSDFHCREVDWVQVKGKLEPVKIYELLCEGQPNTKILEMSKHFGDGYAKYHERKFHEAIRSFEAALICNADDETSKIYVGRCQELLKEPPDTTWDGVYVMKTK